MVELKLTETERVAKSHLIKLMTEALHKPCDSDDGSTFNLGIPSWYDEQKFRRGQKYFADNRFGMMSSNLCGLLTLLSEPRGLRLLSSTGKSSTVPTAKKRYVSTVLHMLSWYEIDLSEGSKSWESLKRVRKMHMLASRVASKNEIGIISQNELAQTVFGFMGFALLRPHLLGIRHDCREDREAFVHFWAVMGHILGIEDQFSICLHPLEVVEMICRILMRYIFIPLIQLESPEFKEMTRALIDGLSCYLPGVTYENQLFLTRRALGVPGYQFEIDIESEIYARQIFTVDEVMAMHNNIKTVPGYEYMNNFLVNGSIMLLDIRDYDDCFKINENNIEECLDNMDNTININGSYRKIDGPKVDENGLTEIHKLLGLKHPNQLAFTEIPPDADLKNYLNSSQYDKLSVREKMLVKWRIRTFKMCETRIGRFICEAGLGYYIGKMRKFLNNN